MKISTIVLLTIAICLCKQNLLSAQVNKQDSLTLVNFYNVTNGPNWINHTNWLTNKPVSSWYGISLTSGNRVGSIILNANNLGNKIPSLNNLTALTFLSLSDNNLSGNIPSTLTNITLLVTLDLGNNLLSGSIPHGFSNLHNLHFLYLDSNKLTGRVPYDFGMISGLIGLKLNSNKLSEKVPDLTQLTSNLKTLSLDNNNFTFAGMGSVVKNFPFATYSNQGVISLNKYGDSLSVYTGGEQALSNNTYKWYKDGSLVANIPADSVFRPNISGSYFVTVTNAIATSLTLYSDTGFINVQANKKDSLALIDLYNYTDGKNWNFNNNWLSKAPLSTWFGVGANGTRVDYISLQGNGLKGTLPASLSNLTAITNLSLTANKISGSIPSGLGKLLNLEILNFTGNQLSGKIPVSIGNLTKLIYLQLDHNKLSGTIPASLGNLTKLIYLLLSVNKLNGIIPDELSSLTNLQVLSLAHNNLSGNIPAYIGSFIYLHGLELNDNNFSGVIPAEITNLDVAAGIYLKSNNFTFAGMEEVARKFSFIVYSPQANIKVHNNQDILSVSAGGTLSNNKYKWYNDGILVATITGDSSFKPTESGLYYAVIKNAVAIRLTLYSDSIKYTAPGNLITSQIQNNSSIFLYPNPAKTNTTLAFNATGKYSVTIVDVSGKTLLTKTGISSKEINNIQLDVSNYASGMYLIIITDEKKNKQVFKLNKE